MSYTRDATIPAVATATFASPGITFYVRLQGGVERQLDNIVTKAQVDLGLIRDTYRNDFDYSNTDVGKGYLLKDASTGISVPDPIAGTPPRFLSEVKTCWVYTDKDGGVYHFSPDEWLDDGPNPTKYIGGY